MLLSAAVWIDGQAAHAQTCGGDYTIKEGESLADIAARVYGNSSQWPLIFYANQDRMGANASMLVPGLSIRSCMSGQSPSAARRRRWRQHRLRPGLWRSRLSTGGGGTAVVRGQATFLTADGYPFTDRRSQWRYDHQIVSTSMTLIRSSRAAHSTIMSPGSTIMAHLNPLLITRAFDAGLPGPSPIARMAELSQDAVPLPKFFLDPLFEFTVLFVRSDRPSCNDEIASPFACWLANHA
jgi:polar amino acid transport system substrate-binding protein